MTIDRPRKIGLRQFAQAVFEIRQHDTGRRAGQVDMNCLAEFHRHGGRGGQVLSHAVWQEALPFKGTEDTGFVTLALRPGLTARRVICKGAQPRPYLQVLWF